MHCPSISELPPPPPGVHGWPWTEGSLPVADARPDGSPWPRISIVTPSYNQGYFIEETLRSVLLQGYPSLEFMVLDGGSVDGTVEIIRKYAPWLAYWASEPDDGQTSAIRKGLHRSSGEIFQWINSDDVLLPGTLGKVGSNFGNEAIAGGILVGDKIQSAAPRWNTCLSARDFLTDKATFCQPGLWLPCDRAKEVDLDESFHFVFDWIYACRYFLRYSKVSYLNEPLAFFRLHHDSKTVSDSRSFWQESFRARKLISASISEPELKAMIDDVTKRAIWHRFLQRKVAVKGDKRLSVACLITHLALRKPGIRLDRYSLGALRRVIFRKSGVEMSHAPNI